MRRGFSYRLVPALAAAAALFGLIWGWIGINAAIHGGGPVAYLLIVFGFGGIVLALALWRSWKTIWARKDGG
jgi:hypothetical protein